ncbi:acetylglutamate kinase [Pullulanibacillus pueri]|uniref:Acetylglutamate kinase n=1 Tax=Pullulanibacillus pueri TaxID=1437324 RepID=A0A8J3EN98_9BACL|nr:acetylglutamate kinase [Pullulanibacillus pueri]MBM7683231.1 acetylglutamate kinase [Pullulanibacillus pueri]GGH85505.1 acetylglutamate kinase [Pullulanibacillus pueri]
MKYLVIKCGGSAFQELSESFYKTIVSIQKNGQWVPVIVHGGGPMISNLLDKLQIETHFHQGLRVTTEEVLDVVEMVLSGSVNKQIVRQLVSAGGQAVGMSGIDGGLLEAIPNDPDHTLGFVGKIVHVETELIEHQAKLGYIPVISPLAMDYKGQRYNINGDTAAAAVAQALKGYLCIASDISGIQVTANGTSSVLREATSAQIEQLIIDGVITGGMIPKVKSAIDGLHNGVKEAVILNGLEPDQLTAYVAGKTVGTKITLNEEVSHA